MSCTALNRLVVSHRAHWSNSLLETVTNQSCIYFRNIRVSSNELDMCARCDCMTIPLHVPLELKWQAVLIELRNILRIGVVTW